MPVDHRLTSRRRTALFGRAARVVALSGVVLALITVAPLAWAASAVSSPLQGWAVDLPGRAGLVPQASVLTDATGAPIAWFYDQYRRPTEAAKIAAVMKAAIVAIEDRRFYEHGAVDLQAVARALVTNTARTGDPLNGQGASTLTMQYVKDRRLYSAHTDAEREAAVADTLERKLRDIREGIALENHLGKDQILTRYLDTVYFGHGAYGITAAAQTYFATTPDELTLPQAALLAGLVKSPGGFDPVDRPDRARQRRGTVLQAMAAVGAISPAEAARARSAPLGVVDDPEVPGNGCAATRRAAAFFCRFAVDQLATAGVDLQRLRTGGYTVRTTLDPDVSAAAARVTARKVPADRGIANVLAVVRPGRTARPVLALAANRDLGPDATAGQTAYALPTEPVPFGAGSIFKIFTAAAALDAGLGLDTPIPAPESYTSSRFGSPETPYTVTGANGASNPTTLRRALALSPNTTFVALLDRLGSVDPVVDMARRLGLRHSLDLPIHPGGPSIADAVRAGEQASFTLGPVPVIPLELASVVATIVSGGTWCAPNALTAITGRDGPVEVPLTRCAQVIPKGLADTLAAGLSGDIVYGTAAQAAADAGWDRPTVAKTGTTQRHRSAGFVGATPQAAGAAMTWADGVNPAPICVTDPPRLCRAGTLYGGTVPARTWFAVMSELHRGAAVRPAARSRSGLSTRAHRAVIVAAGSRCCAASIRLPTT